MRQRVLVIRTWDDDMGRLRGELGDVTQLEPRKYVFTGIDDLVAKMAVILCTQPHSTTDDYGQINGYGVDRAQVEADDDSVES